MANVSRPARPVILVADDTPANLGVLFELLGRNDYDVLVAEDGESALQRVEQRPFATSRSKSRFQLCVDTALGLSTKKWAVSKASPKPVAQRSETLISANWR